MTAKLPDPNLRYQQDLSTAISRRRLLIGTALVAAIIATIFPFVVRSASAESVLAMHIEEQTSWVQNFNPFDLGGRRQSTMDFVYEPLVIFNDYDGGKPIFRLATGYKFSDDLKSITYTLRDGVKWSDGQPLTSADMKYTLDLMLKNKAVDIVGVSESVASVEAPSPTEVKITLKDVDTHFPESMADFPVVPEHIWKSVGNPATFVDPSPVGTGPTKLGSFTPQGFTLVKNPSYWQASQMQVPKVFFPVYTSNTSALSALFSGHIDWTGNYIPGLQHSFISTNPEFHHHWEAPGGTNSLVPNLNKWPTNQLPVRQAISAAINRQLLASEGESGLENPVLNATGLTPQLFDAWSGPVASMTVSATGSAAAAQQILQKAGYTKGSDGFLPRQTTQSSGQPIQSAG